MRNPPWHRDELILALDLYFRHPPSRIRQSHPEVVELSRILDSLPIHEYRPDAERFRNANGVYMKLCNFLRLDRTYKGRGLRAGGKAEAGVWLEFNTDRERLTKTANALRLRLVGKSNVETTNVAVDEEGEFPEGRVLFRAHRSRERNRKLVARVKQQALKRHGRLFCQICGFDFAATYGTPGEGYIECHHLIPITELAPGSRTKPKDVSLLCSNCHRMVHRRRPWLSMEGLRSLIVKRGPKHPRTH